ncbi:glycoside hydrolase family 2 protein [Plicaturopsis crispa FD-325 SS-3]|nr:glycoside hydrolase family 2 protein [Plicaturopsis crispa FD-325 SS-3]
MLRSLYRAILTFSLPVLGLAQSFPLSELQWTLKNRNGSISVPGYVPSQTHLDLWSAGVIDDPLRGINDFTERWIADDDWTYTADLSPFLDKRAQNTSEKTLLVFYGLDTVANITLAGHPVAWVNNQFQQHIFDVSSILASPVQGNKNLTVAFESAWHYGQNVSSRPDAEFDLIDPLDSFEYPAVRQWVRKTSSDFGWDWGPAFLPSGIFKPAYFVTLPSANSTNATIETATPPLSPSGSEAATPSPVFIDEFSLDIYKHGQSFASPPVETADWVVNVTFFMRSAASWDAPKLSLAFPELGLHTQFQLPSIKESTVQSTRVSVNWTFPDGAVKQRWFPHTLGMPKLYNLTTSLQLDGGKKASHSANSVSFNTTTGFRTVTLVQTPYSKKDVEERGITPGDNWHFEVNGVAFYTKGTNVVPFDPFYARIDPDKVRWVLESAKKTGQNMLRVWGGGIYQPSEANVAGGGYDFYSLCDELGILAWSEFIFADALYPVNDWFLATVEPEIRQNVRRVNRHPSNVQWAGGNENEGIVLQVAASGLPNATIYVDEFEKLYKDFLHDIVVSETHSVAYTDCSTTNGVLSLDPYVLRYANATPGEIYGNTERYNYDASQAFNLSTFPVSRFVNEFGFHSMPSIYSWAEVLEHPEDYSFNSSAVAARDHHPAAGNLSYPNPNAPAGQFQMTSAVELWLPTPSTNDSYSTFAQWCWSTQVFQSMTTVAQIAWYRRGAGRGENNLGSLVWQLNDVWQGISWSAIEYSGRWKVMQYGIAGAYAPVIISPFWYPGNETLEVVVTSDELVATHGSAQLTWYDWLGTPLNSSIHDFTVPALNNSVIYKQSGLSTILPTGKNASEVWLHLNVTAEVKGNVTVVNEQYFTPTSLANATLVDPKINLTATSDLSFTLSARGGVAPWTWLDHPAGTVGYFVDNATGLPSNGFYLIPGSDRTLNFVLDNATSSAAADPSQFVVRSLWNSTH